MTITLSNIRAATIGGPLRAVCYSIEGWGKTTFGSLFPDPVFITPEDGFPRDLANVPQCFDGIATWTDVLDAIDVLIADEHEYKTLVLDTLDWIEPLCHAFVCQRDSGRKTEMNKGGHKLESIEDYGYGKGYVVAAEEFRNLISRLVELREKRGMHVVVLSHAHVKKFANPDGEDFDRWEPKVNGKVARLFVEWSDAYLFGFFEVEAGAIGEEKRAKGVSTGRRMFGCQHRATWDAKNRLGMPDRVEVARDRAQALVDNLIATSAAGEVSESPPPAARPSAAQERQAKFDAENAAREERERASAEKRQARPSAPAGDPGGTYAAKTAAADSAKEERADAVSGEAGRGGRKSGPASNDKPAPAKAPTTEEIGVKHLRSRIMEAIDTPLCPSDYAKKVRGWVDAAGENEKKLQATFDHVVHTLNNPDKD